MYTMFQSEFHFDVLDGFVEETLLLLTYYDQVGCRPYSSLVIFKNNA